MKIPSGLVTTTVLCAFLVPVSHGLECYICTNQDQNNAKCTSTIQLCEPHQDRCMTEVRWGSTPYWAPTGEKQFYISKWCSNQTVCEYTIRRQSKRCDRIWYNDWECSECCTGDRCNFYVTLGASGIKSSVHLLLGCVAILAVLIRS